MMIRYPTVVLDLIETYWDVKRDVEVLSVHDFAI